MEKGPQKKNKREYQNPLTVFQAVHSETKASAPRNAIPLDEREEMKKEEDILERKPDDDFLFPLNIAF
jgi:hypothetical protein